MKRISRVTAVTAVALVTLAACSSSGGNDAAGSLGQSTTSTHSADDETMAGTTSNIGPETNASTAANTPPAEPGASAVPETSGATPTTAGTGSTTVISGDLDAQTAAWFSEMCSGTMEPFFNGTGAMLGAGVVGAMGADGAGDADPAALQQQVVTTLREVSSTIANGLDTLKSMPLPTIDHGADIAQSALETMASAAATFGAAADELAAVPVTDMDSLGQAITELKALETLDDDTTDELDFDEKLQAQVMALPACEGVFGPMAGLATS